MRITAVLADRTPNAFKILKTSLTSWPQLRRGPLAKTEKNKIEIFYFSFFLKRLHPTAQGPATSREVFPKFPWFWAANFSIKNTWMWIISWYSQEFPKFLKFQISWSIIQAYWRLLTSMFHHQQNSIFCSSQCSEHFSCSRIFIILPSSVAKT